MLNLKPPNPKTLQRSDTLGIQECVGVSLNLPCRLFPGTSTESLYIYIYISLELVKVVVLGETPKIMGSPATPPFLGSLLS